MCLGRVSLEPLAPFHPIACPNMGSLEKTGPQLPPSFPPSRSQCLLEFSRIPVQVSFFLLPCSHLCVSPNGRTERSCMSYGTGQKGASQLWFSNSHLRSLGDTAGFLLCSFLLPPSKSFIFFFSNNLSGEGKRGKEIHLC